MILALDVPSLTEAEDLMEELSGSVGMVKIGMELFTSMGPAAVELARSMGYGVMLDLKYKDIPNTVAGAVREAGGLGVRMLTVHADGGPDKLEAAAEAAGGGVLTLAVTVLTSISEDSLRLLGVPGGVQNRVRHLARIAADCGITGVVCSPLETGTVKALRSGLVVVNPGIRPDFAAPGDQRRYTTPRQAALSGADFIVVGRPIRQPPEGISPTKAARMISEEFAGGLDERRARA